MDQDERSKPWTADAAVYEITRFFPVGSIAKKVPALCNIEGVEAWVELHLRSVLPGKIDMTKEAIVWTQVGNSYAVCIEGSHSVSPTLEALRTGMWQAGDWLITVSGIAIEQLQAGDLLVQERNASKRSERKRKSTTD
jgi:hypothetical protein